MPKVFTPITKYEARKYYWRSFKRRFKGMWRDIRGIVTNRIQK